MTEGYRGGASVARTNVKNYCQSILKSEILTADGRRRDRQKMEKILGSLVRNTTGQVSDTRMLDDTAPEENWVKKEPSMHINTLWDHLGCLDDIHAENLEARTSKLRFRTAVKTAPIRHLSDPAIAAYFLGASVEDLLYDPETPGPPV